MRMPVMQVRIVRVFVDHGRMPVPMRVRLANRIVWSMAMLVMFIMPMPMLMHHLVMPVLMLMLFGYVQIDAKRHQGARYDQAKCDGLAKYDDGQNRTDERRRRKIRPGTRRTEMAQSQHKQSQTDPVTRETNNASAENHGKSG